MPSGKNKMVANLAWAFFNDQICVRVIVEAFLLSVDSFIVRHILICRKYDIERNQGFSFYCFV